MSRFVRQDWKGLGTYGTVGLEFGLSVLVGLWGGNWLDRRLNTGPWLALLGMAFGIAAGVRTLLRAVGRMNRELLAEEDAAREERRKYHDSGKL